MTPLVRRRYNLRGTLTRRRPCACVFTNIETPGGGRQKSYIERTQQRRTDVRKGREFRRVQVHNERGVKRLVHHQLRGTVDPRDSQKVRRARLPDDHDARCDQHPVRTRRIDTRK